MREREIQNCDVRRQLGGRTITGRKDWVSFSYGFICCRVTTYPYALKGHVAAGIATVIKLSTVVACGRK